MRRLICIFVLSSLLGLARAQQSPSDSGEIQIPPGPPVPVVREMQCQSEACLPGTYRACGQLELTDAPGPGHRVVGSLGRGDAFRVVSARTVVLSAGIVRVTRDLEEIFGRPVEFREGEFLFLLDYQGEGWYSAWRDGEVIDVEQFWPSRSFGPPGNFEYGGELIREGVTEIWFGIEAEEPGSAWVRSQPGSMLDPFVISTTEFFGRGDPMEACPD